MPRAAAESRDRGEAGGLAVVVTCLGKGWQDFRARPTVAFLLVVVYPAIGLLAFRLAFGLALFPLLFPLAGGFALIGPFAAIGFHEISRRRERAEPLDRDIL